MTNCIFELVGFDCETTGTDVAKDRIVSAALVHRRQNGSSTVNTWLINPGVEIPAEATAIHQITTKQVREAGVQPDVALQEIAQSLCETLSEGVPVLIFNAQFDLGILDAELSRYSMPCLKDQLGMPVKPVFDPMVIDRGVDRYRKGKRTLSALMEFYGIPSSLKQHDATEDVKNTIALFDAIVSQFPELPTDATRLHDWQVGKYREWALNFNQWLVTKSRNPNVPTVWL